MAQQVFAPTEMRPNLTDHALMRIRSPFTTVPKTDHEAMSLLWMSTRSLLIAGNRSLASEALFITNHSGIVIAVYVPTALTWAPTRDGGRPKDRFATIALWVDGHYMVGQQDPIPNTSRLPLAYNWINEREYVNVVPHDSLPRFTREASEVSMQMWHDVVGELGYGLNTIS